MRKILFLLLLTVFSVAKAQFVTIPDSNFRAKLMQLYPSCFNGSQQMDTTCTDIVSETMLNVSELGWIGLNDNRINLKSCQS